jgi:hypothetical protein
MNQYIVYYQWNDIKAKSVVKAENFKAAEDLIREKFSCYDPEYNAIEIVGSGLYAPMEHGATAKRHKQSVAA